MHFAEYAFSQMMRIQKANMIEMLESGQPLPQWASESLFYELESTLPLYKNEKTDELEIVKFLTK